MKKIIRLGIGALLLVCFSWSLPVFGQSVSGETETGITFVEGPSWPAPVKPIKPGGGILPQTGEVSGRYVKVMGLLLLGSALAIVSKGHHCSNE